MSSKSYRDGYDGNVLNTGGSFIDYENGRLDRQRQLAGGGGGANGCGLIILFIALLPSAVICLISSLLATPILQNYLKKSNIEYSDPNFKTVFVSMLKFTAIYQLISVVLGIMLFFLFALVFHNQIIDMSLISQNFTIKENGQSIFSMILLIIPIQIPAILVSALVLKKLVPYTSVFKGYNGYLRALVFSFIVITPLVFISSSILMHLSSYL